MRKYLLACGILAFAAVVALAEGSEVTLVRKIQPGETYKNIVTTKVRQTMSIQGMDVETGSDQHVTILTRVGQRRDDGSIDVHYKIVAHQATLHLPFGVELKFDSTKEAEPPGTQFDMFLDILKALSQRSWTVTLDKEGKVTQVQADRDPLASLDPGLRELIKGMLDEEYLKDQFAKEAARIPDHPVSVGDTWEQSSVLRLEGGQSLHFKTRYEYLGTEQVEGKTLHKIGQKVLELSLELDPNNPQQLRLAAQDLKVTASGGALWFDPEAGDVVREENNIQVEGSLTLEAGDQQIPARLKLIMELSAQRMPAENP